MSVCNRPLKNYLNIKWLKYSWHIHQVLFPSWVKAIKLGGIMKGNTVIVQVPVSMDDTAVQVNQNAV